MHHTFAKDDRVCASRDIPLHLRNATIPVTTPGIVVRILYPLLVVGDLYVHVSPSEVRPA